MWANWLIQTTSIKLIFFPCGRRHSFMQYWVYNYCWIYLHTTVATEFGSNMLRCLGGLQIVLSLPANVLSSSPCSQDSVEWSNISVGWFRPNWWLFLEDKMKARKSEKSSNVFVSDRQQTSRMFIIHLLFCTKTDFFSNDTLFYKS